MAETTNALDRDQIAGSRTAVPQSVVGCDSRTQQRCRFGIAQCVGYRCQRLDRSHHIFLISTVVVDTRNLHVLTVSKVSATAFPASVVVTSVSANPDTLPRLPDRNSGYHFVNDTRRDRYRAGALHRHDDARGGEPWHAHRQGSLRLG